jgi:DNA-binding NarL/FixJ family response regulator
MPGMSGLEILSIVKFKMLPTKVILLTMHRELSVYFKAKDSNCDGYVLKDNAELELGTCIQTIMRGQAYVSPILETNLIIDKNPEKQHIIDRLTQTERKVLELVANYKTNKEIAHFLFITEKTVESHKRNIVEKLKLPKGKNILLQWAIKNAETT